MGVSLPCSWHLLQALLLPGYPFNHGALLAAAHLLSGSDPALHIAVGRQLHTHTSTNQCCCSQSLNSSPLASYLDKFSGNSPWKTKVNCLACMCVYKVIDLLSSGNPLLCGSTGAQWPSSKSRSLLCFRTVKGDDITLFWHHLIVLSPHTQQKSLCYNTWCCAHALNLPLSCRLILLLQQYCTTTKWRKYTCSNRTFTHSVTHAHSLIVL